METQLQKPKDYIAVDGWCANTWGWWVWYYRWILIKNGEVNNGKVIFEKEFPQTSNNLTEYLAILEAMKWRMKNDPKIPIYSDSSVALSRVRKWGHNCWQLAMWQHAKSYTEKLENWRNKAKAPFENIYQRFTKKRWDIPADYGKKAWWVNLYPKKQSKDIQELNKKIEEWKQDQKFNLETISKTIYADFYWEKVLKEIDEMTDNLKPNMNQLHFGALIASGVSSDLAYLSVFVDKWEELKNAEIEYNKAFANDSSKKYEKKADLEKIQNEIFIMWKMYASTPWVKRAVNKIIHNEVDTVYGMIENDNKTLLKYLYTAMNKLQWEIVAWHNIAMNANALKNIGHEIALIQKDIAPDNNVIFAFWKDVLQKTNTMQKEDLVNVIAEAL